MGRKDNHNILANTVSEGLSDGYEKLQSSALVIIRVGLDDERTRVKSFFISKYVRCIKVEKSAI
jgi:hypothetical protein